ncbi:DUF423 domain-containing protein [Micromonospora sp. RTP1Z1]|uniref:DUF423 domain-containing protein n=1 Tax=Micromonospora sp. RTP1Z1 TaxID=2994043 RepID=UPI0029C63065|nr:DUF423 domain-containing protein [Micromonospora sp. RTP1Z1]
MTAGVRQEPRGAVRPRTPRLPVLLALLVGVAGVGYRLALLLADAPPTNSDEATMGLAALHIARGQDFPVWFYGQAYMGTLEAYLAAPLVALTGPSVLALRLPTLALYALFLLLAWRLTRRLGADRWFALLVVGFLALGSDRIVKNQLIAGGGYPELNPAGVGLALLTLDLCAGRPGARLPRWAAWGLISGLMLWVDPLLLPYIGGTGAVLVAWRRRELAGRAGVVTVAAILLGAAPMLLDSLRHGRDPLAAVLAASGGGAAAGWGERLHGGLVLGPPLGMGFCSPGHCATWQLWWALALPVLLLLAGLSAWRALRTPAPAGAAVRLALVVGAVAVLGVYVVSSAAGRTPVESARYLSCLAIAAPALLWPLWAATRDHRRAARITAGAVLAAMLGTAAVATAAAVGAVPATHAEADRHRALVDTLDELGVRHARAGYWTCNRLTFASGEDVVCAVVDDGLRPGFDRYPAYRRAVDADPGAAWVAPVGSPLAARLDERLGPDRGELDLVTVEGWRVYLPRR